MKLFTPTHRAEGRWCLSCLLAVLSCPASYATSLLTGSSSYCIDCVSIAARLREVIVDRRGGKKHDLIFTCLLVYMPTHPASAANVGV